MKKDTSEYLARIMRTHETKWSDYKDRYKRETGKTMKVLSREFCEATQPDFQWTRKHRIPKFVILSLLAMRATGDNRQRLHYIHKPSALQYGRAAHWNRQ
jgi:hypothetical protein